MVELTCKLLIVVNDTDEHDVDNIHTELRYRVWPLLSSRGIKGRDHETAGHRGSRVSVEGTSVASSGQNETMGRQTDSHQAQFRGRLFSHPSKQSAAISSGGRRASTVRINAMPNSVLAREICGQIAISRPIPRGNREIDFSVNPEGRHGSKRFFEISRVDRNVGDENQNGSTGFRRVYRSRPDAATPRMLVSTPRSARRSSRWNETEREGPLCGLTVGEIVGSSFAIYGYWQQLFYNADSYRAARPSLFLDSGEGWRERVINPPRVVVRLSSHRTVENPEWKIGKNLEERAQRFLLPSRRGSLGAARSDEWTHVSFANSSFEDISN
ncbi:hypothetical protein DBV15_09690 [Temnothorax longispinosus]|uniref:Uncharacterized protein n=1 Tax=Temnothorax longispinosus TaxID=300112 RepID=A0A4S2JZI9_9HYME|nr:hypothetical protein DBV15_09690 [Temnothorax longispinosus]